jgi:hypothetical protein
MNWRNKKILHMKAVSSIKLGDRRHRDCFRLFAKESQLKHELAKFALYLELRMLGHIVYTESTFYDLKGRADIIDITTMTIYEVLNSEKEENIKLKEENYPEIFDIIPVKADKLIKQLKELLSTY